MPWYSVDKDTKGKTDDLFYEYEIENRSNNKMITLFFIEHPKIGRQLYVLVKPVKLIFP